MSAARLLSPFLLSLMLFSGLVRGQDYPYFPDTSLTYQGFLKQCQEFTQESQQSAWVVMFWASFNGASLTMLPPIKDMMETFTKEPLRFVFISVDNSRYSWEQRLKAYEIPGEHLFLPDEADYEFLRRAFRHNSLPALYLVYPNGDIQRQRSVDQLRQGLLQLAPQLPDRSMSTMPMDDFSAPPDDAPDNGVEFSLGSDGNANSGGTGATQPTRDQSSSLLHTVRKGDTLYSISRQYGVPVANIKAANQLNGSLISVGQKLIIPQ